MSVQKVTVHVESELLKRARAQTGKGVTATLLEALSALDRQNKRTELRRLRGKIAFELDLEKTRR